MKKNFYALALITLGLPYTGQGQINAPTTYEPQQRLTDATEAQKTSLPAATQKGNTITYFNDDFSNGLAGMAGNGAWTTAGAQGSLWFQTFPTGTPNGYNPSTPVAGYGDFIANYYGTIASVNSPTNSNGFMFLDADRFNSTRTITSQPVGPNTTSNTLFAELISPVFSLVGATGAVLQYNQSLRICCSGASTVTAGFSTDGGLSYVSFEVFTGSQLVNETLDRQVYLCLNEIVGNTANLTQCRVKFTWEGPQSHYFWQIDDVQVVSNPENDVEIGSTFYDTHAVTFADPATTYLDYYKTLEIQNTPNYLLKPLRIGAVVSATCSSNPQTNVVVSATVTAPGGATQTITTPPISLAAGATDTIYAEATFIDAFPSTGAYTIDYVASQTETDNRPSNNNGIQRGFTVSDDQTNQGFAIMQNGGISYNGTFNQAFFASDAIINTPFTFPEPQMANSVITHVEAVFLNDEGFAVSNPGDPVYFNVRLGAIGDEIANDPSTITTTVFESDNPLEYEAADLEYIITEEGRWNPDNGFPQVWVGIELPSPILIEPDQIYGAEVRLPVSSFPVAYFPISNSRAEAQTIWLFNFQGDNPGWGSSAGGSTPSIRFRTSSASTVNVITYEAGIKLVQNYPNPFNAQTSIQYQLDENSVARFEVYDLTGKMVYQRNLGTIPALSANTISFDRSDLAAGTYTYSIITNKDRVTRKMTIE